MLNNDQRHLARDIVDVIRDAYPDADCRWWNVIPENAMLFVETAPGEDEQLITFDLTDDSVTFRDLAERTLDRLRVR